MNWSSHGPNPLHGENNAVVEEVDQGENDKLQSFVLERVDPLRESPHTGVDIFHEGLELLKVQLVTND